MPLQAYLDGHATGKEAHFRRAFAPDAILIGHKDGAYRQWPARDYIAASASRQAPADEALRRRAIRQLTVTGGVASAVIELDYPDMQALDHMSLLRIGDEWRIVVKAYEAVTPATPAAMRWRARRGNARGGRRGARRAASQTLLRLPACVAHRQEQCAMRPRWPIWFRLRVMTQGPDCHRR